MSGFRYSLGLGYRSATGVEIFPPGKRAVADALSSPSTDQVALMPRLHTNMAMIARYRVKRWRFKLAFEWGGDFESWLIDGSVDEGEVGGADSGTEDVDVVLTAGGGGPDYAEFNLIGRNNQAIVNTPPRGYGGVPVTSNANGGTAAILRGAGHYFLGDGTDGFDGSVDGGLLFTDFGFQLSGGHTARRVFAGNRDLPGDPVTQVGVCEVRIFGEAYPFPVFIESSALVTGSITGLSASFEPEEFWTYGGRFDSATGM